VIRAARADELELLSSIAFRSKASWGYSDDFMEACRKELSLPDHLLGNVFLIETSGQVDGFYSLLPLSRSDVELGHLFVEPDLHRAGRGRRMIEDAIRRAREREFEVLIIQGDPNAADFYARCGAEKVGERESESIPGRSLPLFKLRLSR
jgi:GNAT superfamily N-acetyltransferase